MDARCFLLLFAGCSTHVVPLLHPGPIPPPPPGALFEVTTRLSGGADPLPVGGTNVAYTETQRLLGETVGSILAPWAARNETKRPSGWQLLLELTRSQAEMRSGRLFVALGVRATLRARERQLALAQTQVRCDQSEIIDAESGTPVISHCVEQVARELRGWLDGLEL
jgi:hypothetical protein